MIIAIADLSHISDIGNDVGQIDHWAISLTMDAAKPRQILSVPVKCQSSASEILKKVPDPFGIFQSSSYSWSIQLNSAGFIAWRQKVDKHDFFSHDNVKGDDNEARLLEELDAIKAERNMPLGTRVTADAIVAKYETEIRAIYKSGRAQFEVYLLIERREGGLKHAEDTLRKAVNKLIPDWRKKSGQEMSDVGTMSTREDRVAPFADQVNQGGGAMVKALLDSTCLKTVAAIVVPQGGEGKTFTTEVIHCIAEFAGLNIALGTNDGTNAALAALVGPGSVASLSWDADAERGKTVVMRQRSQDLVCVDVGANSDPRDGRFLDFAHGAREAAANVGARFVVLVPSATNKGGGLTSAVNAATAYAADGFDVALVLNNRDGSANHGDLSIVPDHIPVGRLAHVMPGFMAYRMSRKGSLHSVISNPTNGYAEASRYLRNVVLEAAQTEWVAKVFWWEDALKGLPAPQELPDLRKLVLTEVEASDQTLKLNAAYAAAYKRFFHADEIDPNFHDIAVNLQRCMKRLT